MWKVMCPFSTQSSNDLIFSETATIDTGAEPDEEKPETPVKNLLLT